MSHPPLVLVVWEDARTLDGGPWVLNEPREYKPHLVTQVGFLLSHTEQGIIMSQAWRPEFLAAPYQIPLGMVRSMTLLEPAAAPARKRTRKGQ